MVCLLLPVDWGVPCGSVVKNPPAMPQNTQVLSPGGEYALEEEMAMHSSILFFFFFFGESFLFLFLFLFFNIVLVLPYINMHPPQVYMCSPS